MSQVSELLAEIETFCRNRRMAETTFGRMAVNDGKFVERIRSGGGITLKTVDRVREFMRASGEGSPLASNDTPARPDAQPAAVEPERRIAAGGR